MKTNINAYLKKHKEFLSPTSGWPSDLDFLKIRPKIICADGFTLSVQASNTHYCDPRDNKGPYSTVEVGFPNERIEEFMPYAEEPEKPTETVYGHVPIAVVEKVVKKHGGIAKAGKEVAQ